MIIRLAAAITSGIIFLSGCASPPQQPIELAKDAFSSQSGRVGVAMTHAPKADTHLPGAGCLLCLAAASVANSSLTTHAKNLSNDDVVSLKEDVVKAIRKKGVDVIAIQDDISIGSLEDNKNGGTNATKKDFTPLRNKYNVDKLLIIDVAMLGFVRTYSSYIPTSDPKGVLQGTGYVVNLKTNTYEWYFPINSIKSANAKWDEPPKFPGLTNAYYQAIETGKDSILQSLVK